MTQLTLALRKHFFTNACRVIEAMGATKLSPGREMLADDYDPEQEYELLTLGGRLRLTVYDDWIAGRFDHPGLAREAPLWGPTVNQFSGKWNHHFAAPMGRKPTKADLDAFLAAFDADVRRLQPETFVRTPVAVTLADLNDLLEAHGEDGALDALRRREAMGDVIRIPDLPRQAITDAYLANVTNADGERPQWLIESCEREVAGMGDVDMWDRLVPWCAQVGVAKDALHDLAAAVPADARLCNWMPEPVAQAKEEPVAACAP